MKINEKRTPEKIVDGDFEKEAISSSARLFYILITMTIIYVFAGMSKIDRNQAMDNLRSMSIIHALIVLAEGGRHTERCFVWI